MNISNQLNQKFFGRKELEILNQKPKPPSIKSIRKPSNVDENYNNDTGVVGYMGNDEDLESIKYDIMDNMNQKMNNFDDRIEKLLNQIQTMEANKDKLNRLELGQDSLLRVVEAEENQIEDVGIEAAVDGSGDIEGMLDVIASARPCTALSRDTESRGLIDKGDNNMCTKFYNRSSDKYDNYTSDYVRYGRSCKAHYLGSVSHPIVENPPNYCTDYNGRVAQKCNTIVGSSPSNAGPFFPDTTNCVKLNNSDSNPAQQLWVDKCSQYLGEGPCNASEDCIYRKIGNEGKCIFNCEKLNTSLEQGNISDDVKCKKDEDGHYESTNIVHSDSLDTSDNSVLQDYCEQFTKDTCNNDKCQWDDNLDVLGYDFKCIPHEDSTTCNLSSPFKQLLKDSGEKCKSLTSSPCCDLFPDVCSYENGTCSSSLSLSWPPDPGYYNPWRLGDYSATLILSISIAIALVYYSNKPKILWVFLALLIIALKIMLPLFIEKYIDFINIGGKPTLLYWLFGGITNGLLLVIFSILSWRLKRNRRDADGDAGDDIIVEDDFGIKGKIFLGFLIILGIVGIVGFFLSVDILSTNEVKDKICDTDIAYKNSHKITEYCNSINESYDRTPEYNIAYGDNDKEFTDNCKLPCKKYSENSDWQRYTPLITCFIFIIIGIIGFIKVETSMKYVFTLFIFPLFLIAWANFVDTPVCKAKNKNDSNTCNSITNPDICKAALHRDGVVNEDEDNKDENNKDKNICFLYHGPYLTYFSISGIVPTLEGLLEVIIFLVVLSVVIVVVLVIAGSHEEIKDKARTGVDRVKDYFSG